MFGEVVIAKVSLLRCCCDDEAVEARDSYAFTQLNRDGAIGKIDLSDFTELDGGVRLLLQDHPRGR